MSNKHQESYDDEPVFYCKRCLSLNIKQMPITDQEYCGECGSADIATIGIDEWNLMYREKYGHDYIVKRELKWPYWC